MSKSGSTLTVHYNNVIYQIQTRHPAYAMHQAPVTVCENAQGEATILYKSKPLPYSLYHKDSPPHGADQYQQALEFFAFLPKTGQNAKGQNVLHPA